MTDPARTRTPAARAFVWAGAVMFAASLAYFLFSYAVTFGERAVASSTPRNVAVDVALFSAFALHHSLFARTQLRSWISRLVSHELERSVYVWIASLMLILVCALWQPIAGVAWEVTGAGVWLLRASMAAGVWLALRSAAILDIWNLAGVRRARARPPRLLSPSGFRPPAPDIAALQDRESGDEDGEFRPEGPYRWVRHPIYTGWFLIVFSVTPMTMTRLVFAVVSCAYVLVAIPLEERTLRASSGAAYGRYMEQVRWKLLPGVYGVGWWAVGGG